MRKIKETNQKQVYIWNMLGNLAAAGSSVLYMLLITRMTSTSTADIFSLVNGIAAVWGVIGLFQVRTFQGTDIKEKYSFSDYGMARMISITLMILTLVPYLLATNFQIYHFESMAIMVLFLLYRMCDAISDLYQGLFQQHERLDLAGKSMTFRYGISVLVLWISLFLTNSLVISLVALFLVNLLFIVVYDIQIAPNFIKPSKIKESLKVTCKTAIQILQACFPLFLSGFLLALIFNEPKQAIAQGLLEGWIRQGAQRDYGILFMPAFFMSLFILILRPLITQLAIYWTNGQKSQFKKISSKLFTSLFVGGGGIVVLSALLGIPVLSLIFGIDLSKDWACLQLIVIGGVFYSVAITFIDIMTIFRQQRRFIPILLIIAVLSKIITEPLVSIQGLKGAGLSFLIVMVVFMTGNFFIYFSYIRRE